MTLDDKALDELERLESKATPGKWLIDELAFPYQVFIGDRHNETTVCKTTSLARTEIAFSDAAFIAAVRNGAKALIAAAREFAKWKDEYSNLCKFATAFEEERDALRADNERLLLEASTLRSTDALRYARNKELLAENDALREENQLFHIAAADDLDILKERDALLIENAELRKALEAK